jgi:hypothetical protein
VSSNQNGIALICTIGDGKKEWHSNIEDALKVEFDGGGNAMRRFGIQMIDHSVSSDWWKSIIKHFFKVGDNFEIRCWKEETEEILQAQQYGTATDEGNEISIKGVLTDKLLLELMTDNPSDKDIYNKMTKYFTINVKNELCDICSAHYGTEMYITIYSDKDILFFEQVMSKYSDDYFSIGEW